MPNFEAVMAERIGDMIATMRAIKEDTGETRDDVLRLHDAHQAMQREIVEVRLQLATQAASLGTQGKRLDDLEKPVAEWRRVSVALRIMALAAAPAAGLAKWLVEPIHDFFNHT